MACRSLDGRAMMDDLGSCRRSAATTRHGTHWIAGLPGIEGSGKIVVHSVGNGSSTDLMRPPFREAEIGIVEWC